MRSWESGRRNNPFQPRRIGGGRMCDCSKCKNFVEKEVNPIYNGLEWGPVGESMGWGEAKELEKDGWRLPTVQELVGLWEYETGNPRKKFEDMAMKNFWSSASTVFNVHNAWYVNFADGFVSVSSKLYNCNVRCVRLSY
jgi:hypothetical protein